MPARPTRKSTSRAAAQTEEAEIVAYAVPNLNYNAPLSWPAGKAISVADLFARLKELAEELREIEQGTIAPDDIAKLAQDLVNHNLLGHKDKGIRAWTLVCVIEILNQCAPNAPFSPAKLKDIFTVIASTIVPALGDPSNAYNPQHQYILDQLVETRCIALIADLNDPETILSQLFAVCFDIVSGTSKIASGIELSQSVVFQLGMMLNILVEECILPQEVIDIILSQFLRVDPRTIQQAVGKKKNAEKDKTQSTLSLKEYPPAYNMAKNICTTCSDKMANIISQYFGAIITNASAALPADDEKSNHAKRATSENSDDDDNTQAKSDLDKAHGLVKELWRACPDALVNVMPQLDLEMAADSSVLRSLAVDTVGDLVAGVGLAGMPELPVLDPAVYPSPSVRDGLAPVLRTNPLLLPSAPKPFIQVHSTTFAGFLGRRIDKVANVRKAWVRAACRILVTNAGGIGLSKGEQSSILECYTGMLKDVDDDVRFLALEELGSFPYVDIIDVLCQDGGLSKSDTLLSTVSDRLSDKKPQVREHAMKLLGSIWGVAWQDLADNDEQVSQLLRSIPAKLFSVLFIETDRAHMMTTIPKILYECLLPLNWPSAKTKTPVNGKKSNPPDDHDTDTIRVRRFLTLIRDLDDKTRPVLFAMLKRQAALGKALSEFVDSCSKYNGGINDDDEAEARLKEHLGKYINSFSRTFPDSQKASKDLWNFVKNHDRRNYHLIKFAVNSDTDYKTMVKAVKELTKRLQDGGITSSSILDTLLPLLYQSALIAYNRSHIPAILEATRSSDEQFAEAAQELLRHVSDTVPEVMKTHVEALSQELRESMPSETEIESIRAADALKACAVFSRRFPEDFPKDRKLLTALQSYALFSTSHKAAKHASSIILTTSDKKELRAKELLTKAIKRYKSPATNRLSQLAVISQVCLYSAPAASVESSSIVEITIADVLRQNSSPSTEPYDENDFEDIPTEETSKKLLALKILLNRCRGGGDDEEEFQELATSTLDIFMTIIRKYGEFSEESETPSGTRNWLRLAAAKSVIKLCSERRAVEDLVKPDMFQDIAYIMVHRPHNVRNAVAATIRKLLTANKIHVRWLTPLLLLTHEPREDLRAASVAFLKSRTAFYARAQQQTRDGEKSKSRAQNIIETTFARLLSLLARHPDYPSEGDDQHDGDLLDIARNIIFYLQCCSNENNISLIFHIAQRVKQAADAVTGTDEVDSHLYLLSDLAQAIIRNFADQLQKTSKNTNLLQTWPGKASLPSDLFKPINGHEKARQIAARNYLPEEIALRLEGLIKSMMKKSRSSSNKTNKANVAPKKRKSSEALDDDDSEGEDGLKSAKKSRKRSSALPIRKTPNPKKRKAEVATSIEQPSRKSARVSTVSKINYEEGDSDESENEASSKPTDEHEDEDEDENMADGNEVESPEQKDGTDTEQDAPDSAASDKEEPQEEIEEGQKAATINRGKKAASASKTPKSTTKFKSTTPVEKVSRTRPMTNSRQSARNRSGVEESSPLPESGGRTSRRTAR